MKVATLYSNSRRKFNKWQNSTRKKMKRMKDRELEKRKISLETMNVNYKNCRMNLKEN